MSNKTKILSNKALAKIIRKSAKKFKLIQGRLAMELMADQLEFGKITEDDAIKVNEKLGEFADTDFRDDELILDAFEILKPNDAQIEIIEQILKHRLRFRVSNISNI